MFNREQFKLNAKQQIKGKIGILFVTFLIWFGISTAVSFIPIAGSIINGFILTPAFSISLILIFFKVTTYQDFSVSEVFNGFSNIWGAFKVVFLVSLFTTLWSLLFIIPGIVKSYSYSMAMYIYAENPEMGALEAINKSKEITHGHKMDLFVLDLSFIGWVLLGIITLGIAFIYVFPYICATEVNCYYALKGVTPVEGDATVVDTPSLNDGENL